MGKNHLDLGEEGEKKGQEKLLVREVNLYFCNSSEATSHIGTFAMGKRSVLMSLAEVDQEHLSRLQDRLTR